MAPGAAHLLLLLLAGAGIALMLLRPRGIAEFYWIDGAVLLMLALGVLPWHTIAQGIAAGIDVYWFLFGMMLLAELAREHGVFDWMAAVALRRARGSGARLFTLVYALGALVTVAMSNDATAVVLTPAIFATLAAAEGPPERGAERGSHRLPFFLACAFVANAASFLLPISNPANLVVFRGHPPALPAWLAAFLIPSLVSIGLTYAALRWRFRRELRLPVAAAAPRLRLSPGGRIVVAGIAGMAAVLLIASALHRALGLPAALAAIVLTVVVSIASKRQPLGLVRRVNWSVLALVAGLFALVQAVESAGALPLAADALAWLRNLPPLRGALAAGVGTGLLANLVNNLPLGMLAASALHSGDAHGLLAHAVLIGVDLGPNLSVTGSLASILWLLALRREGVEIGFGRFLRVGIVVMPLTLALSLGSAAILSVL